MSKAMIKDRKILVIHSGGIGDLVMATPALRSLRDIFPEVRIHFLGNLIATEVFRNLTYIDKIIIFDTGKIKSVFLKDIFKTLRHIWHLRNQSYSALFVLQPQLSLWAAFRMGLFILSLGVPERFGRNTSGRGFFLTKSFMETSSSNKHEVERMLEVVRLSGGMQEPYNPDIPILQDDRDRVRELFSHNGVSSLDSLIAFAPGFGKPTRKWYPERWAQLGDRLADKYNAKIVLVGGLKEVELAAQISNLMKNSPILTAGKTTVAQAVAMLEWCRLLVSNDSGLMHLAAAIGINIVAIFGPGDYNRIRPYGDPHKFVIVTKELVCAPCYKVKCKDHICMRNITVDDVFLAVQKLMRSYVTNY